MVLYEFAQFLIPGRTFDIQDIAASILGGILSYLFLLLIFKHCKSEKKIY
ncbi:VanZ family protein [Pedobacter sp. HMWF019]